MRRDGWIWLWRSVWVAGLAITLGLLALYRWLPADGATGDLESFSAQGFRVQWLLERREGGLEVGDIIQRADGHTVEEWLTGAERGPEWRTGGLVPYEILRDGQPLTLSLRLSPVPLLAIVRRWMWQFLISLFFVIIGAFVFWKRPQDRAARVMMLFCVVMTLQYWGDAFNFQYATLPWRWPFWVQLLYEHGMYSISVATICYFALIFPIQHPLVKRFPRLLPVAVYASHPVIIGAAMALSGSWTAALSNGNHASWALALTQIGLAIGFGVRSARRAKDPVARSQIRWIVWWGSIGTAILFPGYVLPLMLSGQPLLPHPATMLIIALMPFAITIAILRYRLFDIEIVINRTLVYGTLTLLLAALYLLLVRVLTLVVQELSGRGNDTLVVFVATLSIALAFAPLRRRVQLVIDRAFYRTKLDYQRLLREMSERLATSIVQEDLVSLLTEELPRRLQIAWATLAVLDRSGESFVPIGDDGHHPVVPSHHALVRALERRRQPVLRLDPPAEMPLAAQDLLDRTGIELSMPLYAASELVGLYDLGPKQSGDGYTGFEIRLLFLLGRQAAVALENSRLFQAEREQRRLVEALQEAAEIVSGTLELDQVLDRILEQVERVVVGDAFNVMLVEGGIAGVVRWRGYERLGVEGQIGDVALPIAQHRTLTRMMRSGRSIVIADAADDDEWIPMDGWDWLRSLVAAPIVVAGRTVGFLNVDGTRPNQFDENDARRLEAFANHAATALENARLYAETQRQLDEQTALREAGAVLSSTLDYGAVLSRIAEQMSRALDTTSACIHSYSPQQRAPTIVAVYVGPRAGEAEQAAERGWEMRQTSRLEWLSHLQAGQPRIVHIDETGPTPFERLRMEQYGIETILYIPLHVKGSMVGFAELWESRRRRRFTPREMALGQGIAQQAAVALENARLFEQAQQEIVERRRAEERIKASLAEKEVLLKEIHHRVKNNLQVVSSLLFLQSRSIQDQPTLRIFEESRNRVRSMALVHETLYRSEDLARVDLPNYVRSLARYLFRSFGVDGEQIRLEFDVRDGALSIDSAIPCGLILNELISNALKHAFPDGRAGTVRVLVDKEGGNRFTLAVKDDGVGLGKDFRFSDVTSLGMQLVGTLVDQLEGTLEIESEAEGGTTFRVRFREGVVTGAPGAGGGSGE